MAIKDKRFDLHKLQCIFAQVASLRIGMEAWAKIPQEDQYEQMCHQLKQILFALADGGLPDSASWLDESLNLFDRNRQRDGDIPTWSRWRRLVADDLEQQIKTEIGRLNVVLQAHQFVDIGTIIEVDKYHLLPHIAQQDIEDALDCYAVGHYTAAAMLAWRSAEATVREYYRRLSGHTCFDSPTCTWNYFLKELQTGRDTKRLDFPNEIKEMLETGQRQRNQLAHPIMRLEQTVGKREEDELGCPEWQLVEGAIALSARLIQDLIDQGKKLAVGQRALSDRQGGDIYPDILLARVMLHREGGGVGRLERLENEDYNVHDFNYILGMETGDLSVTATEATNSTIAQTIAKELAVLERYTSLIEFVWRWRYRRKSDRALIQNLRSHLTLWDLLEILPEMYANEPEKYEGLAYDLLLAIQEENERRAKEHIPALDVDGQHFVFDLTKVTSAFEPIIRRAHERMKQQQQSLSDVEPAWDNRSEAEYDGLKVAIITANAEKSARTNYKEEPIESLLNRAWRNDYQLVLYTDLTKHLWLRPKKGEYVEWGPLQKQLKKDVLASEYATVTQPLLTEGFDVLNHGFSAGRLLAIVEKANNELQTRHAERGETLLGLDDLQIEK